MQELPVARQAVQSALAVPEVLEMTVVGTTGANTVPSVPVPLVAAVLGRDVVAAVGRGQPTWPPPLSAKRVDRKIFQGVP